MVYLTLEDILEIRSRLAGPHAEPFEVMSFHGLLSALAAPERAAFGVERFPTLPDKAGALVYALIQHHPFWDGNKRIATAALHLFLQQNRSRLRASDRELRDVTRRIALGALREQAVATWLLGRIEAQV